MMWLGYDRPPFSQVEQDGRRTLRIFPEYRRQRALLDNVMFNFERDSNVVLYFLPKVLIVVVI